MPKPVLNLLHLPLALQFNQVDRLVYLNKKVFRGTIFSYVKMSDIQIILYGRRAIVNNIINLCFPPATFLHFIELLKLYLTELIICPTSCTSHRAGRLLRHELLWFLCLAASRLAVALLGPCLVFAGRISPLAGSCRPIRRLRFGSYFSFHIVFTE